MTGEFAEITILRDAGPAAQPTVGLHFYDEIKGQVQMVIDGRIIASATISGGTAIQGPRASALAIAMAQGRHMEVRQNGKAVARVSLDGSAAALRYMDARQGRAGTVTRSEEHTSELQSLMRISYAVFCLKKKNT